MKKRNTETGKRRTIRKSGRRLGGFLLGLTLAVSGALVLPQTGMQTEAMEPAIWMDDTYHVYYEQIGGQTSLEMGVRRVSVSETSGEIVIRDLVTVERPYDKLDQDFKVTTLGLVSGAAFADCTELTSVVIPASITTIGTDAFKGCTGLRKLTFLGTTPPSLNSDWLSGCSNVTIEIPAGADIAAWNTALAGCGCTDYTIQIQTAGSTGTAGNTAAEPGTESRSGSSSDKKKHRDAEASAQETEPVNQIPAHTCQYEWVTVREAAPGTDGEEKLMCKLCGSVETVLTIPAASSQTAKLYENISLAGENDTVTYDLGDFHTISDRLLTTLQSRSDVALVLTFTYQGRHYQTTFPAGADYTELLEDGDSFYGLLGVSGRCGIVTEEV